METVTRALTANIMRIEESPPILKLIEENKKALIIGDRGFLQYDVQRHRVVVTISLRCFVPVFHGGILPKQMKQFFQQQ